MSSDLDLSPQRRAGVHQIANAYRRFTEIGSDGRPRLRVLLAFPILVMVVGIVLVGLSINGTSSGAFYSQLYSGKDPALIAGHPEAIRSDEWNVGVVWTIAQVQQGFPVRNHAFPGGMDSQIPFELPGVQPAVIFEPQLWGYLLFDVNHGTAWNWWLPGLALIVASYLLMVGLMPRRPGIAAVLSVAFFLSPFFQWWYQTSTLSPVAWGAVTIASLIFTSTSRSWWRRLIWGVAIAYATAVMAFAIYAPFIIPVVLVVLFFGIGIVVQLLRLGMRLREVVARFAPVLAGGVVGGVITALWLRSESKTVAAFLGTVYPGARLASTGNGTIVSLMRTVGSSFTQSLKYGAGFLGANSSEASTFFLAGAFLLPVAGWIVVRAVRARVSLPWTTIALAAVLALFLAFMFVPHWDLLAHLLFLDRTTDDRLRIGVGFASFVLVGCIVRDLDQSQAGASRRISAIAAAIFLGSQFAIASAVQLVSGTQKLWGDAPLWLGFALLSAAAIYLLARRYVVWGTAAFLIVSVAGSALVNPIYVGVLDLRTTSTSREVVATSRDAPGAWVGVGSPLVSAILLESGVEAYNGTQGAPSHQMWSNVDPTGKYKNEWDRLAVIKWVPGEGNPSLTNPEPDVIEMNFDACSDFAQKHITHVLSDQTNLALTCLKRVGRVQLPFSAMSIYDVVKDR